MTFGNRHLQRLIVSYLKLTFDRYSFLQTEVMEEKRPIEYWHQQKWSESIFFLYKVLLRVKNSILQLILCPYELWTPVVSILFKYLIVADQARTD